MKVYKSNEIRNIVLLGHTGSGKTTTAEAMLHVSGATKRQGSIDEGNTISDFDSEEIKRKSSINTSVIPVEWDTNKLNVLDTPGYFDFVGEVKEATRVAKAAVIVVSGKSGVQVGTEKAWEYADEMNMPRIIFVNEMDDDKANLHRVLEDLKEKFGKCIAPFQIPIKEDEHFKGFVNVVKMRGRKFVKDHVEICDIPEGMDEAIAPVREMILEAVAETSEELLEKYFEGEEFTQEEIITALHKGIINGSIVPVLCGSAKYNIGIQVLLNSIVNYFPNPKEVLPALEGMDKDGELIELVYDDDKPTSLLVFKSIVDPYIGHLSLFKVFTGIVNKDDVLYNSNTEESERISHLYILKGKEQIEVNELHAGDIGVFAKLSNTHTGDTLCDKKNIVKLNGIHFPKPYMTMAVVSKGKNDEDKVANGLARLTEEDKTLKVEMNHEIHQQLISGMGVKHLENVVHKLKDKFKAEVELIDRKIPYRETITSKCKVQGKYKKQSGGHGQYGDIWMEFEPSGDISKSYEFKEKIFGGSVPKQYFPAVEKGLQECVKKGVLAGYKVVGIKATLVDGSYHPVDSSEMAFKMATHTAFKDGIKKCTPVILEPIMHLVVLVPEDYMGDIMGDLNKRRGRILGMNPVGNKKEIVADVPLAEMLTYTADLKSITGGRGSFNMEFDRYEKAPYDVQERVIEDSKKED